MAIGLEDKQVIVAEVNKTALAAHSAVMAEFKGVTVVEMTALRKAARKEQVEVRVVRNTLARRAFSGTSFECMNKVLTGPNVLAFSLNDPAAGARLFRDFAKGNQRVSIKALCVSGRLMGPDQIDMLANLPTKAQALSRLLATMNAPIAKLARTLNDIPGKVTRAVAAVRDQKQSV